MGDKVFTHLLNMEHKVTVVSSLLALFDQYFEWIKDNEPLITGTHEIRRSHILH